MQSTDKPHYSGERFDPVKANALAHYDHHARYGFVMRSFSGGRLLDVGCGLGVGAAILRDAFDSVLGIDASVEAVHEATRERARPGLSFSTVNEYLASAAEPFDAVTCLEVIEHTTAQRELLELLKSAVKPGGVVIVSTPNREWTERKKIHNPFHVKELVSDEFYDLTQSVFPHVQRWSQLQTEGASIVQASSPVDPVAIFSRPAPAPKEWVGSDVTNFVAVCSLTPRPMARPVSMLDAGCTFQTELQTIIASNEKMIDERDALIRQQDAMISRLTAERATLGDLEQQVRRLRRLEDQPDADALPLRWKLADQANEALKQTPLHRLLKQASGLIKASLKKD